MTAIIITAIICLTIYGLVDSALGCIRESTLDSLAGSDKIKRVVGWALALVVACVASVAFVRWQMTPTPAPVVKGTAYGWEITMADGERYISNEHGSDWYDSAGKRVSLANPFALDPFELTELVEYTKIRRAATVKP